MFAKLVLSIIVFNLREVQALIYIYGNRNEGTYVDKIHYTISRGLESGKTVLPLPPIPECSELSFVRVKLKYKDGSEFYYKQLPPRIYFKYHTGEDLNPGMVNIEFHDKLKKDVECDIKIRAIQDACKTSLLHGHPEDPLSAEVIEEDNDPVSVEVVEEDNDPVSVEVEEEDNHPESIEVVEKDNEPAKPVQSPAKAKGFFEQVYDIAVGAVGWGLSLFG